MGTRFSPHVKNGFKNQGGGGENTPEENLQYLRSLTSDFDEIFTVYSQMNRADNGSMGHGSMGRMGHQNWMGQMGHGSLLSDP